MLTRRGFALTSLALPLTQALPGVARAADAPLTAKIKLAEQRVLIEAVLNGKGPYDLILDTGAIVSGVKDSVARALELPKLRDVDLNGRAFPLYAVSDLLLGGQVRQAGVAMFGLESEALGGDGLLAAGMVTAVDSELDFERQEWRLYPRGGIDRTGYTRLNSELRKGGVLAGSTRIHADVQLGAETFRPVWDTGMPAALSLAYGEARKLGLWDDNVPYAPIRTLGLAERSKLIKRVVRAPTLKIGPAVYENPLIIINGPRDRNLQSVLGLPIIRTLNLSVEPAAEKLWIQRNALSPTPRQNYAWSGIWLDEDKGVVSVGDVGTGSPAAKAGVKAGDVVAGAATIRDGLRLVNGPRGQEIVLKLKRGAQDVEARFVPTDYL